MAKARHLLCFALEARDLFFVLGEAVVQHLHRDKAFERRLPREMHDAHSAASDLMQDLELAQSPA
jgi:hypothetical protein